MSLQRGRAPLIFMRRIAVSPPVFDGHAASGRPCTLYFDGGCPLCRKEVALYQKLDHRRDNVEFYDLSEKGLPPLLRDQNVGLVDAFRHMHVSNSSKQVFKGADAFVECKLTLTFTTTAILFIMSSSSSQCGSMSPIFLSLFRLLAYPV